MINQPKCTIIKTNLFSTNIQPQFNTNIQNIEWNQMLSNPEALTLVAPSVH